MKRKSKGKVLLIVAIVAVVLAGAGFGGWYFLQNRSSEPVYVYPFDFVGMTEYWGDSQESYGPVSTDKIQTVFLSETQTVTEILVQPGQQVKKGDLLMTFDTTLSDLALERERLEVEKLKLQLENAKEELWEIRNMKPMVIPEPEEEEPTEPDKGTALGAAYKISASKEYDGSSKKKPLILWMESTTQLGDAILEAARLESEKYQQANAEEKAQAEATKPTEETEATEAATEETTPPEPLKVNRFYMVVKVTKDNMTLTDTTVYHGVEVILSNKHGYRLRFFDASGVQDHSVPQDQTEEVPTQPEIDFGSGYTAAQIAEMRAQQERTIKDLEFQIKMAEAEYAIKQTEMESGNVVATIDGTVVSLLTEEEARLSQQPLMKLSGGGGFYVQGSVSELEKEKLQLGQEVTVNDWNTGMVYTGTVQSIGDFPAADGYWNGMGNPNASYYPFTVFVGEEADLQAGNYVNIVYSTATNETGVYLENPFLRTEQGRSYVYVQGADGKLEQRFVTTGKSLWGSYTQVLEGLTPEDKIAFPYGKQVVPGADTVEGDHSNLYG